MQDYTYSIFSGAAIVLHLLINFRLMFRPEPGADAVRVKRYRGFLLGILVYYMADAAWGLFAGLRWMTAWYIDTVFFFLSLVAFVVMWARFAIVYSRLGKWPARIVTLAGYALLAFNIAALAANFFNDCFFYFDETGKYALGPLRDPAFAMLIAFNALLAALTLAKAISSRGADRKRCLMALLLCITMSAAIILQIVWPLTPVTALGCLIGNCFFHVFVISDEQTARHISELEKAIARAKAAEQARSLFFSIVSHDIRTPLNAILGYSELLRSGVKTKEEKEEALNSIRASGTTLLQLVNDVLDLAKMDAGQMTLVPSPVRLEKLTDEVFASFRMNAAGKGIELANRTAGVPPVMLDDHRFRQILFNLVGNAVKFTSHGSVAVSASYAGGELEVSVADTGCGIPQDMLKRILEPFVQVLDPTHAPDRANGTGLGLSICSSMVETMGGELTVESKLGQGSVFTIRIPGVKPAVEDAASNAIRETVATPEKLPGKVLVVDDSSVNRAVLTAFLKKAGIASIDTACDGKEALAEMEQAAMSGAPYDFVFSDLWMPNMNGLELIERLRADSRFSSLPVFAVTADTEIHGDARSKLFDGILFKPLTYNKLIEAFAAVSPR